MDEACPFRVNRVASATRRLLPVFPDKRYWLADSVTVAVTAALRRSLNELKAVTV
jgi:hypothetical protein